MSPERRARELDRVESELDRVGEGYKTALDHNDHAGVASAREQLRRLGDERRKLRYRR